MSDILRRAFQLAHQRAGLILLDVSWKSAWAASSMAALYAAAAWFTSDLLALAWDDTGRTINGLIALAVLREFWLATKGEVLALFFIIVSLWFVTWVLAEALMRRILLRRLGEAAGGPHSYPFIVFLASGLFRAVFLAASGMIVVFLFSAGAEIIAVVCLLALAFAVTLVDSLVRADAVELLGTDLFRAAGLVGILMAVELMLGASVVAGLIAGFLNVTRLRDAVVMAGGAAAAVMLLNVLHSYLLLVRFSAIAIMRRNVVEI